jgi:hypothetical protein
VVVTALSYGSGSFTSTVKDQGSATTLAKMVIGVGYFEATGLRDNQAALSLALQPSRTGSDRGID